jgi:hypothetical protein
VKAVIQVLDERDLGQRTRANAAAILKWIDEQHQDDNTWSIFPEKLAGGHITARSDVLEAIARAEQIRGMREAVERLLVEEREHQLELEWPPLAWHYQTCQCHHTGPQRHFFSEPGRGPQDSGSFTLRCSEGQSSRPGTVGYLGPWWWISA